VVVVTCFVMCGCVGFVMCTSFDNMCNSLVFTVFCIVCTVFLYCFVYVYVFLLVSSVLPASDKSIAVNDYDNNNNHNQAVHADREVTANRPNIIIKNKKGKTCTPIDLAVSTDRNFVQKEVEKKL
jgi:hypothetical protein